MRPTRAGSSGGRGIRSSLTRRALFGVDRYRSTARVERFLAGAALVGSGIGAWVVSSRFSLRIPSLIDDWESITSSPHQLERAGWFFTPDGPRFRPAYAVWNYFQWHVLGAPGSLVWPNVVGVLRVALLASGVAVCAALAVGIGDTASPARAARRRLYAALVVVAPLLVVTVPQFGVDLARFGPQEPVQVGAMSLGGSLVFFGCRALVRHADRHRQRRTAVLLVAGYCLWLLGVYQKESSVCVLLVGAALVIGKRRALRGSIALLDRRRRLYLGAIGAAVALPLAQVAIETAVITLRGGSSVLGAGQPVSERVHHVRVAFSTMSTVLGTPIGRWLFVAVGFGVLFDVLRRRVDWVQLGLLATAVATLAWSTQTGLYPSRYYLPSIALLAIGVSRLLARLPSFVSWVAIGVLLGTAELRSTLVHTHLGWLIVLGAGLVVVLGLVGRRAEWAETAVIVGGLAAIAWTPTVGLYPNRYYQPLIAVAATAVLIAVARRPAYLPWLGTTLLLSLAVLLARPARSAVADWVASERVAASFVDHVAVLDASGCPVVVSGLDVERRESLPVLVALQHRSRSACTSRDVFVVKGPYHPDPVVLAICGASQTIGSWTLLGERLHVLECRPSSAAAMSLAVSRRMKEPS